MLLDIKGDTLGVNMAEYVLGTSPSQRENLSRRIPNRFVGFVHCNLHLSFEKILDVLIDRATSTAMIRQT